LYATWDDPDAETGEDFDAFSPICHFLFRGYNPVPTDDPKDNLIFFPNDVADAPRVFVPRSHEDEGHAVYTRCGGGAFSELEQLISQSAIDRLTMARVTQADRGKWDFVCSGIRRL
jgi:hypothetical protein